MHVRFPLAKFTVSCFDNVEEVDTKILTKDDIIIYTDDCNFFPIRKVNGQDNIRYCDVIDQLIDYNMTRKCGHRFMESIDEAECDPRNFNKHALHVYASFWGS